MTSESLERRAEELKKRLLASAQYSAEYGNAGVVDLHNETAQVIEQLLSENRQTTSTTCPRCGSPLKVPSLAQELSSAQSTIASLEARLIEEEQHGDEARQDLDRISAEREALDQIRQLAEEEVKFHGAGYTCEGDDEYQCPTPDLCNALKVYEARRILAENDR